MNAQTTIEELKMCELDSIDGLPIHQIVEQMPEFEGDITEFYQVLAKNLKMPKVSELDELKSKFYISFVIDTTGRIRNLCATDLIKNQFNKEILEKVDKWEPGLHRQEKVAVRMQLPINIEYR